MIQEYLLSQVTGQCRCQLAVMDRSPQVGGASVGKSVWIELNLGTLLATVYYDPAAKTFRIAGSVALFPPNDSTLSFEDVQAGPTSAAVSVSFSWPSILFFDSGNLGVNDNQVQFTPPSIPVSGLYKITAGGQTLTGIFNYPLQFQTAVVKIEEAGTSLIIGQSQSTFNFPGADIVRGLAAGNGMNFTLVGGINDGTYTSIWSLQSATIPRVGA